MAIRAPNRVYEDFVPSTELVSEQGCDVFRVYLPGFKKDQLKVQLTTSRLLKISGERSTGDNKWRRFQKDFQVPPNCNTKEITAKFEGGVLYIRLPSSIPQTTAHHEQEKTTIEPPKPQQPQPQPPPPSDVSEKDDAKLKAKEEEDARARREKEEMPGKKTEEERKPDDQSGVTEASKEAVSNGRRFSMELKKPRNLIKKVVVPAVVLLILGLYISFMFKSFSGIEDQQQSLLDYDHDL